MSDYIGNSKLIYHADRLKKGKQKPITAELFLTNFCNHRCGYCRFHHGSGYIHYDDFVLYVDKLQKIGVEGFILTGGGEPILSPDFDKIVNHLEEKGLPYGINTNFSRFVKFKPKYLKVSIDGSSAKQYSEFRVVNEKNYYDVINNIKAYRKWQNDEGHGTTLGIQSLAYDADHVYKFFEAHKNLDIDYMVFRPLESVHFKYENAKEIREAILECKERDQRVMMNYKWNLLERSFDDCFAGWSVMTVNWNGDVQYCCHKSHEVVGHVLDDDILEKKLNYKTDMKTCEVPCRLSGPNVFMENMDRGEHKEFV